MCFAKVLIHFFLIKPQDVLSCKFPADAVHVFEHLNRNIFLEFNEIFSFTSGLNFRWARDWSCSIQSYLEISGRSLGFESEIDNITKLASFRRF